MKKIFIVSLSLLLTGAFLLTGCSKQRTTPKVDEVSTQPIYEWGKFSGETITIWGDKDDLNRTYNVRAFNRYQELTGNTIEIAALSKEDLDTKVPDAFASDTLERPDIFLSYGGTNVMNLNPDENFYDFTDAPWVDDLSDTALNQAIFNGKVIGLPHGEASVSGTLYNKDIFKRLNLEIPKTQEEFMSVCETLLKNNITPMYLPYDKSTMLLYQFPMDSILKDTNVLDSLNDGTLSYSDIPEMKKIVQWYKTMSDKGYFGQSYHSNDWDGMDTALKSGNYGMMLCWDTWLYSNFTGNPSSMGLMPAFIGVPENGCFEGANVIQLMVNKKSDKLDVALDFINFMADPCNYNKAFAGMYTAPVFNKQSGSITTPQYMESERLINELFYDSTAWSRLRGFSQIDAQYIQEYMMDQCSLDECLQKMDNARIERAKIDALQ